MKEFEKQTNKDIMISETHTQNKKTQEMHADASQIVVSIDFDRSFLFSVSTRGKRLAK